MTVFLVFSPLSVHRRI